MPRHPGKSKVRKKGKKKGKETKEQEKLKKWLAKQGPQRDEHSRRPTDLKGNDANEYNSAPNSPLPLKHDREKYTPIRKDIKEHRRNSVQPASRRRSKSEKRKKELEKLVKHITKKETNMEKVKLSDSEASSPVEIQILELATAAIPENSIKKQASDVSTSTEEEEVERDGVPRAIAEYPFLSVFNERCSHLDEVHSLPKKDLDPDCIYLLDVPKIALHVWIGKRAKNTRSVEVKRKKAIRKYQLIKWRVMEVKQITRNYKSIVEVPQGRESAFPLFDDGLVAWSRINAVKISGYFFRMKRMREAQLQKDLNDRGRKLTQALADRYLKSISTGQPNDEPCILEKGSPDKKLKKKKKLDKKKRNREFRKHSASEVKRKTKDHSDIGNKSALSASPRENSTYTNLEEEEEDCPPNDAVNGFESDSVEEEANQPLPHGEINSPTGNYDTILWNEAGSWEENSGEITNKKLKEKQKEIPLAGSSNNLPSPQLLRKKGLFKNPTVAPSTTVEVLTSSSGLTARDLNEWEARLRAENLTLDKERERLRALLCRVKSHHLEQTNYMTDWIADFDLATTEFLTQPRSFK